MATGNKPVAPTLTSKQLRDKEFKDTLTKDYSKNNPMLTSDVLEQMFDTFRHYAMATGRKKVDLRDMLMTAKVLDLDKKNAFVFKAIEDLCYSEHGPEVDYKTFVEGLTSRIGNPFSEEGRAATFRLLDFQSKQVLQLEDLKFISEQMRLGYNEQQLKEIIQNVGGYTAKNISLEKWEHFVKREVERKKAKLAAIGK